MYETRRIGVLLYKNEYNLTENSEVLLRYMYITTLPGFDPPSAIPGIHFKLPGISSLPFALIFGSQISAHCVTRVPCYHTYSLASQTYFARARILRAPKRGEGGKYVWCIWTGFCVHCRNVGSTIQIAVSGNQHK